MDRARHHLGVTTAPLGDPHAAIDWVSSTGIRGVQWSATEAGMRPRDLGPSARRDIRALLVRREVVCSGVDAIVPESHLVDPRHAQRAIDAVVAACGLAADLGHVAVTVRLPAAATADGPFDGARSDAIATIVAAAERVGVRIADLGGGQGVPWPPVGVAVDPAAVLADGGDPSAVVAAAGTRCEAIRVVDLLRDGMRGPLGLQGAGRLDALSFRIAAEAAGFAGLPVIDCRGWRDPAAGILSTARAWSALAGPR